MTPSSIIQVGHVGDRDELCSGGLSCQPRCYGVAGRAMVWSGRTTEMILTVYLFHTKLVTAFCGDIICLLFEVAGLY